jgi:RND family efflux transporter MFP subunit
MNRSLRKPLAAALAASIVAAALAARCGLDENGEAPPPEPAAVRIGRENIATVETGEIRTGPMVSGALTAERSATVRAQVGGSILAMRVDQGEPVSRGELLARIEARDLRDAAASAEVALRSAESALQVAQSEAKRTEALVEGGALAERDLETARNAVSNAQAQLAAARARLTSTRQQLGDTVIRAPIAGVVSEKPANAGDVVTPGTALVTIIDPSSMQLEASVPSEAISALRVGAPVDFQVRGYPGQTFMGRIERISPAADPVTRQIPIFVSIPNTGGRLIAGLFAEGRVTAESRRALVVPASAVDTSGPAPTVTRVREGRAERVEVAVGLRDEKTERVEIVAGVSAGDILLTGAPQSITPGTPVRITEQTAAGAPPSR